MDRVTPPDALAHIRADSADTPSSSSERCGLPPSAHGGGDRALARTCPPDAMPRTVSWMLTLGGLLLSAVLATTTALGLPLWRNRTAFVLMVVAGLSMVGAMAFIIDWRAPMTVATRCLVHGGFVSVIAMIALGALGGRVWRRFPDPSWMLALSVVGLGMIDLHFSCGGVDALHVYAFHMGPVLLAYVVVRMALKARAALLRNEQM